MEQLATVGQAPQTADDELWADHVGKRWTLGRTPSASSGVLLALLLVAQPVSGQSLDGFYLGTLSSGGRTLDVGLELHAEDGALSGSYYYFGPSEEALTLKGTIDAAGTIRLAESGPDGKATGFWSGKRAGVALTGTWTDAKKTRRWAFQLVRSDLASTYFVESPRTIDAGSNGPLSYRVARVPASEHRVPLLTAFRNPRVLSTVNASLMRAANTARCAEPPEDNTFEADVRYVAEDVLSVNIQQSSFCGAAHPSSRSDAIVIDLQTAQPVQWDDLFRKDATPGQIMPLLFAYEASYAASYAASKKTDAQNPDQEGCQEHWSTQQLLEWGVSPYYQLSAEGLVVQLDLPHVLGSCQNRVTVPYAALAPIAAPGAALARLAGAHAGKPLRYRVHRPDTPPEKDLFYTPPPK